VTLDGQRVFRSPTNRIAAATWSFFIVVAAVGVVLAKSAVGAAFCATCGLAAAILAVRAARSRIVVDERGVIARAPDRLTRRLRWDEVERFAMRDGWAGGVWAKTTSGRWVKLLDVGVPARQTGLVIASELEVERQSRGR
jgi:hypothetical protein